MEMIFDDFDAQLQCEDIYADYIPTKQDLLDMEVAFAVDPVEIFKRLESLDQSFLAILDFDLDDLF